MQLTAEQQLTARQWIADGMKLSEFQKKLETDFGMKMTYMDVRLLVDDLKVIPKDPEPVKAPATPSPLAVEAPAAPVAPEPTPGALGAPKVSVSTDTVMQPGTLVSGKVTFTDGQKAIWYMDQYQRLGFAPETKGYRPSREDLEEFQVQLDRELMRVGM